ncbi:MAG: hypothetical protein AB1705_19785 [Verrucomicrobiota bacterium]
MTDDAYEHDLQQVVKSLQGAGCDAFLRGEGRSRFVFAEYRGRAIEVYQDGNAVYLEFFDEGAEQASKDKREPNYDLATQHALAWLRQRGTMNL